MNQELLSRLQEVDHATWEKIARGIPLKPCGQYFTYVEGKPSVHQFKDAYIPFGELMPEVALAWLQHCLQDAIRARRWDFSQWTTNGKIQALIRRMPGGYTLLECMHGGEGDTEAEALCLAYLEAVKG